MIRVPAEADGNINSAVAKSFKIITITKKEVSKMVEFDAIKLSLSNYGQPLLEMGDSL